MSVSHLDLPHHSLAERLGRLSRLWRKAADEKLAPLGLTHPRWTALWKLAALGNGVSQKELAQHLEIELPSLMRTLSQLEEQSFIERHQSPQDKRSRLVFLTPKGKQILDEMEVIILGLRLDILTGISEQELDDFNRLLAMMTRNAQVHCVKNK